jgi:ribosome-binding protein aMBF1 (putative translation factor)
MAGEDQAIANRNSAEFRAYVDELWQRLQVFSKRSAAIPAEERGSFEWLSAAGAFWKTARERAGLSTQEVALQLGLSVNQVRFLELGLVSRQELSERRLRDYARIVGDPELYDRFRERFEP